MIECLLLHSFMYFETSYDNVISHKVLVLELMIISYQHGPNFAESHWRQVSIVERLYERKCVKA